MKLKFLFRTVKYEAGLDFEHRWAVHEKHTKDSIMCTRAKDESQLNIQGGWQFYQTKQL